LGVTKTKEEIMPNAQHTPGPWETYQLAPDSDPQERFIVVTEDRETEICGVIHFEADARLIAAAPDLLAALEYAYEVLAKVYDGEQVEVGSALQPCANAIAQAKGGAA
jgi:hypothetical protein